MFDRCLAQKVSVGGLALLQSLLNKLPKEVFIRNANIDGLYELVVSDAALFINPRIIKTFNLIQNLGVLKIVLLLHFPVRYFSAHSVPTFGILTQRRVL